MSEPGLFQQTYEALRAINTKPRESSIAAEIAQLLTHKTAVNVEISALRADVEGLSNLRAELDKAIRIKTGLLDQALTQHEAIVKNVAALEVAAKRLNSVT